MKTHIWNQSPPFTDKVNFIDSNNVILGYDMGQCCCENAFWTVGESKDGTDALYNSSESAPEQASLDGYVFDPAFCERVGDGDEMSAAISRLTGWSKPDLFIRLENNHNGYYSHGFTFRGATVIEESL